jgi:hypothetical protein
LDETQHLPANQLPPSVVSSSANIDLNAQYGCKAGEDITAKINEAIANAVAAGANTIDLRITKQGTYLFDGPVIEGEALERKYAGQILFPARSREEGTLTIRISGVAETPRPLYAGELESSSMRPGVVIKSNAATGNAFDVVSSYNIGGNRLSNIFVVLRDFLLQMPDNPQAGGINLAHAARADVDGLGFDVERAIEGAPTFPTAETYMLTMPENNSTGGIGPSVRNTYIAGSFVGLRHSEEAVLDNVAILYCVNAIDTQGNSGHLSRYERVFVGKCPVAIRAVNAGSGGGVLTGTLALQPEVAGPYALTAVIEDTGNRLYGKLEIYLQNAPGRGYPIKGAGNLNIANLRYGAIGSHDVYPIDSFKRVLDLPKQLGCCSETSHVWNVPTGNMTTVTSEEGGAAKAETNGSDALIRYLPRIGAGSRLLKAIFSLGKVTKNSAAILIASAKGGSNEGNRLSVFLEEEKLIIRKLVAGVATELAHKNAAFVKGTTQELAVIVTCPPVGGPPTELEVYLDGALALSYVLTAEDRASLTQSAGENQVADGFHFGEDTESHITSFEVIPLASANPNLPSESIIGEMIKALAITEGKIGAEAVTEPKIKNLAVNTAKINNEAVTEAKLAKAIVELLLKVKRGSIAEVGEVPITAPTAGGFGFTEAQAKQIIATLNEIRAALHATGITA